MSSSKKDKYDMPVYLKRPPSLSDSFLYMDIEKDSINRVLSHKINQPKPWSDWISYYTLQFLFHLVLIGFFETLFFFYFVSKQENNALQQDVNDLLGQLTSPCSNATKEEKQIFNLLLNIFLNTTELQDQSDTSFESRTAWNQTLFVQGWVYELCLIGLFFLVACIRKYKAFTLPWKKLILENCALVLCLALYEILFFKTIVFQYRPLSTYELEEYAFEKVEELCEGIQI